MSTKSNYYADCACGNPPPKNVETANQYLLEASTLGHPECMRRMYDEYNANDLSNALACSADRGSLVEMEISLARGACDFIPALRLAARGGHVDCAKLLIKWCKEMRISVGEAFLATFEPSYYDVPPRFDIANMMLACGVAAREFGLVFRQVKRAARELRIITEEDATVADGQDEQWMGARLAAPAWPLLYHYDTREHTLYLRSCLSYLERKWRARLHAALLDTAIALAASGLPPYCLLWVTDWAYPGPLTRRERVAVLEGARNSLQRIRGTSEDEASTSSSIPCQSITPMSAENHEYYEDLIAFLAFSRN